MPVAERLTSATWLNAWGVLPTCRAAAVSYSSASMTSLDAAIPLGRMAQPSEIADVVVFLASGRSAYLTATTVFIDGGIMQGSVGL